MLENILTALRDPLIQKAIGSGIAFILLLLVILLGRRFINASKIDAPKKALYRPWIDRTGLLVFCLILIRIWTYDYWAEIFPPSVTSKLITSGLGLILLVLVVFLTRRLIHAQKIEVDKRHQYNRWVTYGFIFLYALILVRIWVSSDLFESFKNPAVEKLLKSGIAFGFIYLILLFVRRFINSLKIDIQKRHQYRTRASYIATLVYILILIPIWAGTTQQWATVLSVMGAGVALALHEVLLNIAGWVYIVISRPYRAGDRIEMGTIRGDVIDIRLFQTTLLEIGNWVDGDQSTGRVVHLPHGQIFRNPLYNYTKGFEFLWNEIAILVCVQQFPN